GASAERRHQFRDRLRPLPRDLCEAGRGLAHPLDATDASADGLREGPLGQEHAMPQITNRIDHVAWMCRPENHDAYVEKLSRLFNVTFEADDGGPDFGMRITWSWSAGLEVLSPAGEGTHLSEMGWNFLDKKGEGLFAVVMGVDDVQGTIEHARSLGYAPSDLY